MLYNNIDMTGHIRIMDVRGRGLTEQELTTIRAAGSDVDHVSYRGRPKRFLEIDYEIRAKDKESLRKKIDEVSAIIKTTEYIPVVFPDELDRTYYCEYAGAEENIEYHHIGIHRGTIVLFRDPDKYGPEKTEEFTTDSFAIENNGTTESNPIFELTAKKKATFAMVANGAEEDSLYNMVGIPADVDEELVDDKETIVYERGDSLSSWSKSGTQLDEGKVTDGELGTDGTGIHPLSYGSPGSGYKGWYGPALMKEIDPIQDFEVEMRLRANTSRPDQLYRIEFYLYDENMTVLGKMAVRDYAMYNDRYAAEGRVGEFQGGRKGYQISKDNYLRERSHFHGLVRMRRIGQRFEVYVARLKTGEEEGFHHDILNVPFNDINDEHQGKLRHVQINILRHTDGPSGSVPRINALKVTELKEVLVDQTPYILYPDDIVTFDHKNDDILLNGEPRNDLKNFGGSFFTLEKGYNSLITWPPDTFDTKVIHRDKFL